MSQRFHGRSAVWQLQCLLISPPPLHESFFGWGIHFLHVMRHFSVSEPNFFKKIHRLFHECVSIFQSVSERFHFNVRLNNSGEQSMRNQRYSGKDSYSGISLLKVTFTEKISKKTIDSEFQTMCFRGKMIPNLHEGIKVRFKRDFEKRKPVSG
jgi:hypothetical protein